MNIILRKTLKGFMPADAATEQWADKLKTGEYVHGKFSRIRNLGFHKKFFALLNLAYDLWEPGEIDSKYGKPEKNFERFRKDLIILAGYYHTEIRVDGSVRVTADSISFGSMDQDTFEKLYSNILDVILQRILPKYSAEDVEDMMRKVLEFA